MPSSRPAPPASTSAAVSAAHLSKAHTLTVALRPLDWVTILSPLGLALFALLNAQRVHNGWQVVATLLAVSLGGFLARTWASMSQRTSAHVLGEWYVLPTMMVVYSQLNPLIDFVSPNLYDPQLAAIDQNIFGLQPSIWLQQLHNPWLTEIALIAYSAFFLWQVGLGYLLYRRKNGDYHDYVLTVSLFYMLSFVSYMLVPAVGPRFYQADAFHVPVQGLWLGNELWRAFTHIPMVRDCFPSGHTGLTLLTLYWAYKKQSYRFFWFMLPFALMLLFSTLYCRFHYAIDLLCALPFALGILIVHHSLERWLPRVYAFALPFRLTERWWVKT